MKWSSTAPAHAEINQTQIELHGLTILADCKYRQSIWGWRCCKEQNSGPKSTYGEKDYPGQHPDLKSYPTRTYLFKGNITVTHVDFVICPLSHKHMFDAWTVLHSFIHSCLQLYGSASPDSLVVCDNCFASSYKEKESADMPACLPG